MQVVVRAQGNVGVKLSTEFTLLTGLVRLPLREALSNVNVWVMASFRTQKSSGLRPQT